MISISNDCSQTINPFSEIDHTTSENNAPNLSNIFQHVMPP